MIIKESWKNNPLYLAGKVELVPTDWIWKYWGRDVSPLADLIDGTSVDLDGLWKNILDEGLHNPLIMRIGLHNKKFRLESGNHRIQVLHRHHIQMIPVVVQVRDVCGPEAPDVMTDAGHNFDFGDEILITTTTEEYLRPSEVFKSLQNQS